MFSVYCVAVLSVGRWHHIVLVGCVKVVRLIPAQLLSGATLLFTSLLGFYCWDAGTCCPSEGDHVTVSGAPLIGCRGREGGTSSEAPPET